MPLHLPDTREPNTLRGNGADRTPETWLPFVAGLRAFVARRVPPQEVEDVTQEVLLRLVQNGDRLRHGERAEAWVFSIARHTIADFFRQRHPQESLEEDGELARAVDPTADLKGFGCFEGEHSVHEEVLSWLRPLVQELPPTYGQALLAADFEGETQQQLAHRLGLSLSGAKSRVQRGRKLLKDALLRCCEIELEEGGRVTDFRRKDCSC
ncbi:MAG: sigma-70 family RNA polymerase sigma factor [Acidobacteria bacterium]|nr:sigma-70 family RNA polymerase sigma factor [Acidobacteriota bacterium]